ncbi:M14 family zinc carboxypeptidase [Maribacter sp. HTCC2170]|uniref:M14 family zinc carboxypeptidase n=1 Tax=Maribacter sp. (strain HTCC2170 / KCCM 42371) TaxID=313603 RepID=UPI00030CD8E2|nr:M14 family zinc carboxypeptidase [Maribacter sp. HTCC2170]
MKLLLFIPLALLITTNTVLAQSGNITESLYDTYEQYKEPTLRKRRVKHYEIQSLISKHAANKAFTIRKVGESIEGRALNLVSIGSGKTNVLLWSQMHGDEPTATQGIFDIFNFMVSDDFKAEKKEILDNLTVHFLPMLNPDGAERFQRRNLLGVDINRDALRLQSPESKTLKYVRDSLNADFGFNLHDQSTYYNAELTEKPATISYLAPAFNYEKDISEKRGNAMKIIVFMNNIIQKYAPGQVGRYNDDFEPRAFGDNIQKWGTSTILIESGGYANDIEKQEIRKLNYVSILSAIYTIAKENYKEISIDDYEKIPENDRKLFNLKITNATYNLLGKNYVLDLGINRLEVDKEGNNDFWYSSRIIDQGDLSTYYGYETFDATGYEVKQGKIYPNVVTNISDLKGLNVIDILKQGCAYVRVANISNETLVSPFPLNVLGSKTELPDFQLKVGNNPTFILEKKGVPKYAVINGFLIDLESGKGDFENAMIYR